MIEELDERKLTPEEAYYDEYARSRRSGRSPGAAHLAASYVKFYWKTSVNDPDAKASIAQKNAEEMEFWSKVKTWGAIILLLKTGALWVAFAEYSPNWGTEVFILFLGIGWTLFFQSLFRKQTWWTLGGEVEFYLLVRTKD